MAPIGYIIIFALSCIFLQIIVGLYAFFTPTSNKKEKLMAKIELPIKLSLFFLLGCALIWAAFQLAWGAPAPALISFLPLFFTLAFLKSAILYYRINPHYSNGYLINSNMEVETAKRMKSDAKRYFAMGVIGCLLLFIMIGLAVITGK